MYNLFAKYTKKVINFFLVYGWGGGCVRVLKIYKGGVNEKGWKPLIYTNIFRTLSIL